MVALEKLRHPTLMPLARYIPVRVRVCVCVAVRVCVCAGRRDDPPRLGRALLLPAGMLCMFPVGLRPGFLTVSPHAVKKRQRAAARDDHAGGW